MTRISSNLSGFWTGDWTEITFLTYFRCSRFSLSLTNDWSHQQLANTNLEQEYECEQLLFEGKHCVTYHIIAK